VFGLEFFFLLTLKCYERKVGVWELWLFHETWSVEILLGCSFSDFFKGWDFCNSLKQSTAIVLLDDIAHFTFLTYGDHGGFLVVSTCQDIRRKGEKCNSRSYLEARVDGFELEACNNQGGVTTILALEHMK